MNTTKLGIRFCSIIFWISVIVSFLFMPKLSKFFKQEKSLNIFTWPLILDAQYLQKFEKETGIKLYITYYESSEELMSKLKATGGKGYDIILPSDHAVEKLIQQDVLKKIDKTKLDFLPFLNPLLLNNYYDQNNEYSLPYFWGIYGLGINKASIKSTDIANTWGLLFDAAYNPQSIVMTNNPREAIMITAQYLFGSIDNIDTPEKMEKIKRLLVEQKQWVQVYTDARTGDLLASGSSPVVATMTPDVWRAKNENDDIDFIVPQEGSFIVVESFVIPRTTNKDDLVYKFLNFVYRPEVVEHHVKTYDFCSPITNVILGNNQSYCPTEKEFNSFDFFRNVLSEKQLNELWIDLMSH